MINGCQSTNQVVTSGVTQGSVLGPLLFLVYVNDMPDVVGCMLKMFADDTKLYSKITRPEDKADLQNCIDKVSFWTNSWRVKLNIDKCKQLTMATNHQITHITSLTIVTHRSLLPKVTREKTWV